MAGPLSPSAEIAPFSGMSMHRYDVQPIAIVRNEVGNAIDSGIPIWKRVTTSERQRDVVAMHERLRVRLIKAHRNTTLLFKY